MMTETTSWWRGNTAATLLCSLLSATGGDACLHPFGEGPSTSHIHRRTEEQSFEIVWFEEQNVVFIRSCRLVCYR
ncbi:unnamed protein product [Victoria cruziana]